VTAVGSVQTAYNVAGPVLGGHGGTVRAGDAGFCRGRRSRTPGPAMRSCDRANVTSEERQVVLAW